MTDDTKLTQLQINDILETRLARLERYLQWKGHDITAVDVFAPSELSPPMPINLPTPA